MPKEATGIDFGSSSIKLVHCRSGIKGIEVVRVVEVPLSEEPGYSIPAASLPAGQAGANPLLQPSALFSRTLSTDLYREMRGDLTVAVEGQQTLTRILTLPSADSEKLEQIVRYEMEGLIPLPLEEVAVAHHLLSSANGKGTVQVLAAAVPKALMRQQLEWLIRMRLEPKAVELDALALYNAFCYLEKDQEGIHVVMDLGAGKTTLCLVENGKLLGVRTILSGGRDLTGILKEKSGSSFEEAERAKQQKGLEAKDQAQLLIPVLDRLLSEIKRTIHLYTAGRTDAVRSLRLCGGGARLKGLPAYLSQSLGFEPKPLAVPSPASGTAQGEIYVQGLGLAVKGLLRSQGSHLDFRSGEFAYAKEDVQVRGRWRFLAIAAAVVLLLAVVNGYVRYASKESRYQSLKAQLRSVFQSGFPQVKNIVDEVQQAKAAVAELNKKAAFFGGGDLTALGILAEISQQVPKDTRFDVQDFSVEGDKVRIEAETNSFDSVDKIKADLVRFPKFKEVSVGDAKVSADQTKVKFRISITLTDKL